MTEGKPAASGPGGTSVPSGGAAGVNQAVAEAYDRHPYESHPFTNQSPEHLAAMARLFGLAPPAVEHARVLELGCSSGGNLIPVAVRQPGASCVGIDISAVQVAQGLELVNELGLRNCELLALDIADASERLEGRFDYIICHGVFSWVSDAVRSSILDLVRERLTPDGVACISYNVYPGWKQREAVREMMLFHAGAIADPDLRVAQARAMLDFTSRSSRQESAYGQMLREETRYLAQADAHYLLHEHLGPDNQPFYFRDFMALARARGLGYLGDGSLFEMSAQRLGAPVQQTLSTLSKGDILLTEQYLDFITNRTFRQTLLMHQDRVAKANRTLTGERLAGMSFSTQLRRDPSFVPAAGALPLARLLNVDDQPVSANSDVSAAMLWALADTSPAPMTLDALVNAVSRTTRGAAQEPPVTANAVRAQVTDELISVLMRGLARMHGFVPAQPARPDHPTVSALVRAQARRRQAWVTNQLHQLVGISAAHALVLELMDGSRDVAGLTQDVGDLFVAGKLSVQRDGVVEAGPQAQRALGADFTAQCLREFKGFSLLE